MIPIIFKTQFDLIDLFLASLPYSIKLFIFHIALFFVASVTLIYSLVLFFLYTQEDSFNFVIDKIYLHETDLWNILL
jgi:hypothetical protein